MSKLSQIFSVGRDDTIFYLILIRQDDLIVFFYLMNLYYCSSSVYLRMRVGILPNDYQNL